MALQLYDQLTPWYRLLDPVEDHAEEARCFADAFEEHAQGPVKTLLELGAGAGHNGYHLKQRYQCTLSDLAEPMLELSRELNPECQHVQGDMRNLRLERTFDAVLVHDGVLYMTTEGDLRRALQTAFVHTRPGGVAIVTPDFTRETFAEDAQHIHGADGDRAMHCLEWTWDPDPRDTRVRADYIFALRQGAEVTTVQDVHTVGLFPRATWLQILVEVGYEVTPMRRPIGDGKTDEVFVGRRQKS